MRAASPSTAANCAALLSVGRIGCGFPPANFSLEPSAVYEGWCSQRPGGIIAMIEEIHGRPVKAGDSFSAAHVVGCFDTTEEMHTVYNQYQGPTALAADSSGWKLAE